MVELIGSNLLKVGYKVSVCTLPARGRLEFVYKGIEIISVNANQFQDVLRSKCVSREVVACVLIQDPLGFIIWALEGFPEAYKQKVIVIIDCP